MVSRILKRILGRTRRSAIALETRLRVWAASKHLSGPERIRLQDDEVALVCLVKNGSYYLDEMLAYHRAIGIRHFLFIDNGSEDDTVEKLAGLPDVTTVSNRLPVAIYEAHLRADIARRIVRGGWFLFVDSDEFVEMVYGSHRSIGDYARYCNEHGFDAVVCQSLDLFSDRPLSETKDWTYGQSISAFNQYSLHNIDELDYHDASVGFAWFLQPNVTSNPEIKLKFGGIRRDLLNENCALTHHRLVRNAPHILLYSHPHCSTNVHCADFTLLLRHYKFAGNFISRERQQVRDKIWAHGEGESRLAAIKSADFTFNGKHVQQFSGTEQLLDQGFLTASTKFLASFRPHADPSQPRDPP